MDAKTRSELLVVGVWIIRHLHHFYFDISIVVVDGWKKCKE
jgi:hypothetical protein